MTLRQDLKFNFGSTELLLMLDDEVDSKGQPARGEPYQELRADKYASQQWTGDVSETAQLAEVVIPITQDYFHAGFGQRDFKEEEKYAYGVNVDTRCKGKVMLAGALNDASTIDVDILNKNQENWKDANTPYNWTSSNVTIARSTDKYAGTYCCEITIEYDGDGYYRYTFPNPTAFQGEEMTITARIDTAILPEYCSVALKLTDDDGSTSGTAHTGDGSYAELSVTRTIAAAATYIYLDVYCDEVTLADGGFEDWTDSSTLNASNWVVEADNGVARATAYGTNEGAYCARIGTGADVTVIYHDFPWDTAYQGQEIAWTACTWSDLSGQGCQIGINDGIGATTWTSGNAGSVWDQLSVTHTMDASATRLRLYVRNVAGPEASYIDGPSTLYIGSGNVIKADSFSLAITGGLTHTFTGTPLRMIESNSQMYLLTTNELCRWDETNSRWLVILHTDTTGDTDAFVDAYSFNNYTFVAGIDSDGDADFWWSASESEVFTQQATATAKAYLFPKQSSGATLWFKSDTGEVKYTTNPEATTPTISSATSITSSSASITSICPYYVSIFIGTTAGLQYIYSDGTLYPGPQKLVNSNNFAGMSSWESGGSRVIVCPVGVNGLELYDNDGILYDISPSTFAPQQTDFHGRITATCDDGRWMYYFTNPTGTNSKTKLIATRYEYVADSDWRLHPLNEIDLNPVNCAHVSGLQATNPRLWYAGAKAGVVGVGYITLSTLSDPSQDSAYRFTTDTAYLYSSWKNCGTPSDNKVFFYNDTQASGLISGHQAIAVSYEIDTGSNTALATLTADGTTRSYYAVDKTGKEIRHKYALSTDSTTKTPVLIKDVLGARNAAPSRKLYKIRVKTAGEVIGYGGSQINSTSTVDVIAAINSMADYHYVKMTPCIDNRDGDTAVYVTMVSPSPKRVWISRDEFLFELIGLQAYTS